MGLSFPTLAEQVSAKADEVGSVSIALRQLKFPYDTEKPWPSGRVYIFEDDTRLVTKGAGKNYTKTTELP